MRSLLVLAASAIYIVGSFGVSMFFNVPLNDALAAATPTSSEGAALWARYLTDWTWWKELLSLPHAGVALRAMHETGALSALLPEWERVESRVTRDFYHRYTVDEHTLVAIETLEQLQATGETRFAELFADTLEPDLLDVPLHGDQNRRQQQRGRNDQGDDRSEPLHAAYVEDPEETYGLLRQESGTVPGRSSNRSAQ